MRAYALEHLSNRELEDGLPARISDERRSDAVTLAYIAEFDDRRLYLPAGYPSMHAYCLQHLKLSEGSTLKRIHAARAAREHPMLFEMLADGRLNMTDIVVLRPHLTRMNAEELIREAAGKTRVEIEEIIARRFPRTEALPLVCRVPSLGHELSPGKAISTASEQNDRGPEQRFAQAQPVMSSRSAPRPGVEPIAQERYSVHVTFGKSGHEDLRTLQDLLSHQIPSGNINQVLEFALSLARRSVEKRKFAVTTRPRATSGQRPGRMRTIPAHVRRAVRERDGSQCTFVGKEGNRCTERRLLEFDHTIPVARGGMSTVENVRLRCRAHNQYEADRAFGEAFMSAKREARWASG